MVRPLGREDGMEGAEAGLPLGRLGSSGPLRGVAIAPGVARFFGPRFQGASEAAPDQPFPAYVSQPKADPKAKVETLLRPRFSFAGGRPIVSVGVAPGTSLYGTGEVAGPLLRNARTTECWNFDRFDYSDESPSLYQSHPFVLGVREDGSAFGVICETTRRVAIHTGAGIVFELFDRAPSPVVAIIERGGPAEVVRELSRLTGTAPMPPMWALGYHQCRWSYENEMRIREVSAGFRERKIPADVIWFDIDYMDGFRCFTHDAKAFPSPKKLNADLHKRGFKVVYMIDPGLKVDPKYKVYAAGLKGDHFVRDAEGKVYEGKVWPGECAFPDFTRRRTREWWGTLYKDFMSWGIDGVWNDMNEPAVFEVPTKTMPLDNRHDGDAELGGAGDHRVYHNVYGMQMVRASREGIEKANPGKRTFVLTRANFLGGHRYAATWTGDNRSDWRHLRWSIPMALNLGLSGQPLAGPDIGGFIGNADAELFARWMGIGALLPFCRAHSDKPSEAHEPWVFGPECEEACRLALLRRYRLMPYIYTLMREACETGLPIARPLFFADPSDARLRSCDDSFLLGGDVLVRANTAPGPGECASPMPMGAWREFEPMEGVDRASAWVKAALPRLYVREGAIVPMGPAMQFVGEKKLDPLTLVVNPGRDGSASGTLYEDDGDGHGYAKGEYRLTTFTARRGKGGKVEVAEAIAGKWKATTRKVEVVETR